MWNNNLQNSKLSDIMGLSIYPGRMIAVKKNMREVYELCLAEKSADPIVILEKMMSMPTCRMHGPEHHVLVGAALLTAYHNAGGNIELSEALEELYTRATAVPGAACGLWGACGACISTGQFLSIVTGSGPLAQEPWGMCIQMTSNALNSLAQIGGPRCCKRDSYLSVLAAIDFAAEQLSIHMDKTMPVCTRSEQNRQCIGSRCPFFGGKK